jgi:hypothetical protein
MCVECPPVLSAVLAALIRRTGADAVDLTQEELDDALASGERVVMEEQQADVLTVRMRVEPDTSRNEEAAE